MGLAQGSNSGSQMMINANLYVRVISTLSQPPFISAKPDLHLQNIVTTRQSDADHNK